MSNVIKRGVLLFAVAIAALGAENLACAHVSQLVFTDNPPGVPVLPFAPPIPLLVYLIGIILLAAGACLATNIRPRFAASLLGVFFLVWDLVVLVPKALARPLDLNIRTCVFEVLALGASALTSAGCLRGDENGSAAGSVLVGRWIGRLIASAPYIFGISSVVFGVTHFFVLRFIASLVPAWIPGALFWAYFTGAGFIAAGISIVTGARARLGAFWLGVMFLLWFLILHIPRVVLHPRDPDEWSSALIALGLGGGAWIVAGHSTQGRAQATQIQLRGD